MPQLYFIFQKAYAQDVEIGCPVQNPHTEAMFVEYTFIKL